MTIPTGPKIPKTSSTKTGHPPAPTYRVALVGTEGAGKTVLTAVLAKLFSGANTDGIFLNPVTPGTLKYVERVWQRLQHHDWPPSTPPGHLFELHWQLQIRDEVLADLRLVDGAGQDLRLLFGATESMEEGELPGPLQALAEYCRSADIVLFLINWRDFLGEGDATTRIDNQAAIKAAMDQLVRHGDRKRFCLLFTQKDLYQNLAENRGGWLNLAAKELPYIHAAYLGSGRCPCFPVSAVNQTEVVTDDDGTPRRVPKPGFKSEGLRRVIDWVIAEIRDLQLTAPSMVHPTVPLPTVVAQWMPSWLQPAIEAGLRYSLRFLAPLRNPVVASVGAGTLLAITVMVVWFNWSTPTSSPTRPNPVLFKSGYQDNRGFFDDTVTIWGRIKNKGASGNVVVEAWITENGIELQRHRYPLFLNAGEERAFEQTLTEIANVNHPHKVYITVGAP